MTICNDVKNQLTQTIIPFWEGLKDTKNGGYYGLVDMNLHIDKKAAKGGILNSRILWFFSNAYMVLGEADLISYARQSYEFLKEALLDKEYGGVYWSVKYNKEADDSTKHTYNQAFAIYGLASYYSATNDSEALKIAYDLFELIESKCCDEYGYLEAFDRRFNPISNDKLSENGVMAQKTMNTLLHVFEAYTELYRVDKNEKVADKLRWIMDIFAEKIYNPKLNRQEVFFDETMHSLIDLHSYGHDIETSWLIDLGCEVLGDAKYTERMTKITDALAKKVYDAAFENEFLYNECCNGVVDKTKVWWVQAETIVGFVNVYQKHPEQTYYLDATKRIWEFIKENIVDKRKNSEWFWEVNEENKPNQNRNIVDMWKCPYHNGRMCLELIKRETKRG